jgi:hypothetical protein
MREGTQETGLTAGTVITRGFHMYLGVVAAMMVIDVAKYVGGAVIDHFTGDGEGSESSVQTLKPASPEAVKIRCFLEEVRKNRNNVVQRYTHNPSALAADLQAIGMLGHVDHSRYADEIAYLRGLGGADHVDPETVTPPVTTETDVTTRDQDYKKLERRSRN